MKTTKKLLAFLLCLVMVLGMATTVMAEGEDEGETQPATPQTTSATIDTSKTGSLTIHKYEYNGTSGSEGTGSVTDAATVPSDAEPLAGVEFTIYKVMDQAGLLAYYDGNSTNTVTVADYLTTDDDGKKVIDPTKIVDNATAVETTDEDGIAAFTGLALGMYVVLETDTPDKVTDPAEPFLISVPMTEANTTDWLYDIHVYPKNATSLVNITFVKEDASANRLAGVKVDLYKKDDATGAYEKVNEDSYVTDSNGQFIISDLTIGKYYLVETETLPGYILDKRWNSFEIFSGSVVIYDEESPAGGIVPPGTGQLSLNMTNERPDVTKEVYDGSTTAHETQTSIGGTVKCKITVDVPGNIKYLKTFKVTDAPEHMQVDLNSVVIKDGNGNQINSVTPSTSGNGFTIDFNSYDETTETITSALVSGRNSIPKVTIEYEAVLLDTAVETGNVNTVDLAYSKAIDPANTSADGEADLYHIKDSAVVYTYGINLMKYGNSAADGNELAGVQFELYQGDSTDPVEVVGSNGNYRLATDEDAETDVTTTLVTADGADTAPGAAAKGQIIVAGLEKGTYYLKETKTADDYNLLKDKVELDLNISTETKWTESTVFVDGVLTKRTLDSTTYTVDGASLNTNGIVSENIINKSGFTLPTTGAMSTLLFSVLGCALVLAGVIVLMRSGRKKAER